VTFAASTAVFLKTQVWPDLKAVSFGHGPAVSDVTEKRCIPSSSGSTELTAVCTLFNFCYFQYLVATVVIGVFIVTKRIMQNFAFLVLIVCFIDSFRMGMK
jgi:hypothetical protein